MKAISGDYTDPIGQRIANWYVEQSKWPFYTVYTAIGFEDEYGYLRGAAIFTDFNGANIELHFIGSGMLNRRNIKMIGNYVFNELKCVRLTIRLLRKDKKIAKLFDRLGFEYECTLKSYYGLHPSQDALVFRMFRQQAEKWIE